MKIIMLTTNVFVLLTCFQVLIYITYVYLLNLQNNLKN